MFKSSGWTPIPAGIITVALLLSLSIESVMADSEQRAPYGIGRPAAQAEIQSWDIDISPNGDSLPSGRGTVKEGAIIYADFCASCHGETGIEGPMPALIGGHNTLNTDQPLKTVGSFWPFATTLFDYIYRAMPLNAPQSLAPQQVYAVAAWILFRNGLIKETATLDAKSLPNIQMPNRNNFVSDPRPDISEKHP
ncbi:MAG: cytochrome c [Nitrospirales bacterium]|nr:MAG: cytochrome c [Nitrospirales bacterium]